VYFHAELRPRLRGWRSASKVRSQVWRGRPGGRLQSLGSPLMETLSALVMSRDISILVTCPKNRSHLAWMSWERGAVNRLGVLPWRWLRGTCMERKHILSKASTLSCAALVRAHVSQPYNKTGWIDLVWYSWTLVGREILERQIPLFKGLKQLLARAIQLLVLSYQYFEFQSQGRWMTPRHPRGCRIYELMTEQ